MAAIAAGERQIIEQARDALVEDGAIVAAGFVAERRGDPALADAGRSADQQVGVVVDPAAFDKLGKQRAIEPARGAVVDVLDARLLAQLGVTQPSGESLIVAQRGFAFEQQREPFGVAEICGLAGCFDVDKGFGHALKAERIEAVEGRMSVVRQRIFCALQTLFAPPRKALRDCLRDGLSILPGHPL